MSRLISLAAVGLALSGAILAAPSAALASGAANLDSVTASTALVSPASTHAGIGARVTIRGTGFGSLPGRVVFPSGTGGDDIAAIADSWSDTEIVCAVPRYAESGTAVVRLPSGAAAASFRLAVGFSFNGAPAPNVFSYRINENTADMYGEGDAMRRALQAWSGAGAKLSLEYGGVSDATGYRPGVRDGHSDIIFVSGLTPTSTSQPNGPIAKNWRYFDGGGKLVESDIYLNDSYVYLDRSYPWGAGASTAFFDLETVVLHELGHTVGLDDQYDDYADNEVMSRAVLGQTRHELSAAERDGAIWIYGAAPGDVIPPVTPSALVLASSARLAPAYAKSAYVAVSLHDADASPLSGRTVKLYYPSGKFAVTLVESSTTPGLYRAYAPVVRSRTAFSAEFAGDGAASSAILSVIVKPQVKLTVNAPETPKRDRTFYVYAGIAPAHHDARVVFEAWRRKSDGSYYRYATKTATTSDSSFRKGFALPAGRWRFRTVHSDTSHSLSKSGWDYIIVTK